MVIAWLVLAVVLVAVELHHLAFYTLFVAVGALAAAAVAAVAPGVLVAQGAAAVGVSVAGIVFARPQMSRSFARRRGLHVAEGVHGGLIGQQVTTLDVVGDRASPGHVRLAGERWLAMTGGQGTIPSGAQVVVTDVRGTTLVVLPLDIPDAPSGAGGSLFMSEIEFPELPA